MKDLQLNPDRLKIARLRRKMTYSSLAEAAGLSSKSVAEYEKECGLFAATPQTIELLSKALAYPVDFLCGGDIEFVDPSTVSFRSLKSMKAADQHAAESAGSLGVMVSTFFESLFNLPDCNLPNLRGYEPEAAAEAVREYWGLGVKSITNMIHLLELNGVRVFSLSENTVDVDAFSFWKNDTPFIFLNTKKNGERSRFDAAHELGHLVLHRHGSPQGKDLEDEADSFASALLMPRRSVLALKMPFPTLDGVVSIKDNWKVSSVALIVRMKSLGILTEWQYRILMVEANKKRLRSREINGIPRERSIIIEKALNLLKMDNIDLNRMVGMLNIPLDELANLLFKVAVVEGGGSRPGGVRPDLKLI